MSMATNLVTVEDLRYLKLALYERLEASEMPRTEDVTAPRLHYREFLREMLARVLETIERCEDGLPVTISEGEEPESDTTSEVRAKRMFYKDTPGVGKEIYADIGRGLEPVVQGEACFGYEPWVQFGPEERDSLMHELYVQMVDAWNEKYGESNAETI